MIKGFYKKDNVLVNVQKDEVKATAETIIGDEQKIFICGTSMKCVMEKTNNILKEAGVY